MADDRERRRADRVPVIEVMQVDRPQTQISVVLRDISRGGVRFGTDQPLGLRDMLLLRLRYSPLELPLRAVVVWCRPSDDGKWEAGAEFLNMESDEVELLMDHIDSIREALQRYRP